MFLTLLGQRLAVFLALLGEGRVEFLASLGERFSIRRCESLMSQMTTVRRNPITQSPMVWASMVLPP